MESNYSNLEQAILKALAFFDIFDYPLTLIEIHKWLYRPNGSYTFYDVLQCLQSDNLSKLVKSKNGFYFFIDRENIITTRLRRYQLAEEKYKIAFKATRFLRWVAFIKLIAVCNNVGYNNGSKNSDIDFFIIVRQGRLWWSRLIITLVTTMLGIRRYGVKVVDRVCLSFYTADNHLNLSDIALDPADPYLAYWFVTLAPIYDRHTYDELMESNSWLKEYLPNYNLNYLNDRRKVKDRAYINIFKKIDNFILQGKIGDYFERVAQLLEQKRIKNFFGDSASQLNTNVIISKDMLKLHKTDRRDKYRNLWKEKLNQFGV